jgi:DNA-directed RNA polymerase subunit alpha
MCYKQLCQYDSAVEEFQRAADRGADDVEVKLAIGECLALGGKFDDAAKLLKQLRAGADHSNYHVVRGLLLQAAGQHEQAEEAFGEALDIDPDNTSAAFRLAFLYDLCGEDAQAVELYTECLHTPPVSGHALINLAVLYEDAGDWDSAQRCLETLLSVKPGHPRARLFMRDVLSSRSMYYDEDQERRTTQRNAVLDIPVTDFELSVRARNCLKKMNIRTLGDLLNITEIELLAYKNFGETSLTEIKTMLNQKGLRLGQDLEARTGIQAGFEGEVADEAEEQGAANVLISELELSVRSRKALQRLNLSTIVDLANCTETQLLACKNFGQTSLSEIKQRLAEHGLNLRGRK